jgi:hypothetical protein
MKKLNFFIAIFFILLFGQSFSKTPPPGTGSSDIPANILLLLDKSGSMGWPMAGSGSYPLNLPQDIAIDESTGNIFISETNSARIAIFNSSGTFISYISRFSGCSLASSFSQPNGIFIKDGVLYVADSLSRKIIYLTFDELIKLYSHNFESSRLNHTKDFYCFGCCCLLFTTNFISHNFFFNCQKCIQFFIIALSHIEQYNTILNRAIRYTGCH